MIEWLRWNTKLESTEEGDGKMDETHNLFVRQIKALESIARSLQYLEGKLWATNAVTYAINESSIGESEQIIIVELVEGEV
jgi:hypothetical protein